MTEDVKQWLGEIRRLHQELETAHQERDQAYSSAANWRSLYETEAQQRRAAARLAQQRVEELQAEIAELRKRQTSPIGDAVVGDTNTEVPPELTHLTEAELRQQLLSALKTCDRLKLALAQERTSHEQTRQNLTVALGDTVDLLTKERGLLNRPTDASKESHAKENPNGS
jgi:septum formation topological specificity factor MinE